MSKIRNSLGLLVLPATEDSMTWEAYKEKYGIDLHSIFDVLPTGEPVLKSNISKVLVMDQTDSAVGFGYTIGSNCLRLAPIVSVAGNRGGEDPVNYNLELSSDAFTIVIRHAVYADDTPDDWIVLTREL